MTKTHLFDNKVKTEDHLSMQKIIIVLVEYGHKMETTLVEMRKLLPGPSTPGTSQPPLQAAVSPSSKGKVQQMMDNLKDHLQERKVQEAVVVTTKIVVPTLEVFPIAVPEATPKEKSKEKESESRATSLEHASQMSGKKKAKVPTPEIEELKEEEESTAEDTTESEEEDVPSTPPPDQQPRKGVNTRSSRKKKPGPVYRSPFAPKRQSKTPGKGEGSNKKPRGK